MRCDQHPLARLDGRRDAVVPQWHHPLDRVFQAFGQWNVAGLQLGVTNVLSLAARVAGLQRRRRRVVAAPPDQHLRVAVLLRGLGLVQALQRAVVALVEPPCVHHRQPGAVHLVECVPQRPHRALEHRGVGHIEIQARLLQQAAGLAGLFDAGGGELHIGPAGETVLQVPGRFAVAYQHECVHGSRGAMKARGRLSAAGSTIL